MASASKLPAGTRTERLASWASNLRYADIPKDVVEKTKDFFLDTLGCTIAGRQHPAVVAMSKFAVQMGPSNGKSELVDGDLKFTTSPAFASLVNGASSHVVEQDDLHNSSIMHPVSFLSFKFGAFKICLLRMKADLYPGDCHIPCCPRSGSGSSS